MRQDRVLRISLPTVGSSVANQTSPRITIAGACRLHYRTPAKQPVIVGSGDRLAGLGPTFSNRSSWPADHDGVVLDHHFRFVLEADLGQQWFWDITPSTREGIKKRDL
jgi:hypothetical protein